MTKQRDQRHLQCQSPSSHLRRIRPIPSSYSLRKLTPEEMQLRASSLINSSHQPRLTLCCLILALSLCPLIGSRLTSRECNMSRSKELRTRRILKCIPRLLRLLETSQGGPGVRETNHLRKHLIGSPSNRYRIRRPLNRELALQSWSWTSLLQNLSSPAWPLQPTRK